MCLERKAAATGWEFFPILGFFLRQRQFSEAIHTQYGVKCLGFSGAERIPRFFFLFLSLRHALVWWCASHCFGQKNSQATSLCKFSMKSQSQILSGWMCWSVNHLWKKSLCMYSCLLLVTVGLCSSQVVDVAKAIINAIKNPDAKGKTYALAG